MPRRRIRLRVGLRLQYVGSEDARYVSRLLRRGDILEVTETNPFAPWAFRARMPDLPDRRGYSANHWFDSDAFGPAGPATPEERAAANAERRAIECPKVNLP